jgi:putative methionine-R-sulfoxide reductase with GAF domain/HAMP domain-containing protein
MTALIDRPTRNRSASLSTQLLWRVLALSLIAALGFVFAAVASGVATLLIAQQDLNRAAADAVRSFDLRLIQIETDTKTVADSWEFYGTPSAQSSAMGELLKRNEAIFEVTAVAPDGQILGHRTNVSSDTVPPYTEQPWLEAVQNGTTYKGPVDGDSMLLAVPIEADRGTFSGTLLIKLQISALWQDVINIQVGDNGYGYLTDADGRLLAYSNTRLVQKGVTLQDEIDATPKEIGSGDVVRVQGINLTSFGIISVYDNLKGKLVVGTSEQLDFVPWYAVVEQPFGEAIGSAWIYLGLLFAAFVLSGILVYFIARFVRGGVVRPLRGIVEGTQIFGTGFLEHRISVKGSRELVELADTLNQMAQDLKSSRAQIEDINRSLEQRVGERVRDLETVAEVSTRASGLLDARALMQEVSDLTKENFGLYHAHIYLLDEGGDMLTLAAGAGDVGRKMVEVGHKIALDRQHSLVALAARTRQVVVADDVRSTPSFLPNPLLPQTKSELAVALVTRGQLLGVLDVQSDQLGRFGTETQAVMETLARQIAAALSNARLFEEVEHTVVHDQVLGNITSQMQSALNIDEVLQVAARELGKALKVSHTAVELQIKDN